MNIKIFTQYVLQQSEQAQFERMIEGIARILKDTKDVELNNEY